MSIVLKANALKRKSEDSAIKKKNLDEALKVAEQKRKKNSEEVNQGLHTS